MGAEPKLRSQPLSRGEGRGPESGALAKIVLHPGERRRALVRRVLDDLETGNGFKVPMLPNVAARAIQMAGKPDVSLKELHGVVGPDPVLSARVLSIANSSLYGAHGHLDSVRLAACRLGTDVMRDLLYQSIAEAHVFTGAAESFLRRQRLHATGVAYLTRDVCEALQLPPESAFAAGLMHDIGCVLTRQVLERSPADSVPTTDYEYITTAVHCRVGSRVCEDWKLPLRVAEGIIHHHDYRRLEYSQIGHIIAAAERLAEHAGLGERASRRPLDLDHEACLWELGLDATDLQTLSARADALAARIGLG